MEFFVSGRQVGKTYYLLSWLAENPDRVMICANEAVADKTFKMSQRLELEVSREQFVGVERRGQVGSSEIAVDNIDLILHQFFPSATISKVTATGTLKFPKFP